MIDYEEILARLRNGEKVDDIAKNLTEVLNEANRKYEAEQASAKREKELNAAYDKAVKAMNDAIIAYGYYNKCNMESYLWNRETCRNVIESYRTFGKVFDALIDKPSKTSKENDFNTVITDFLKEIGC